MGKSNFDYGTRFQIYKDDPAEVYGKSAPYVDYGTEKPNKARYYSMEEAELEWQHLWMKSWSFAGILQDVPNVGDWLRFNLGKESFIVVRVTLGDEGLRAFYNVCPHRGNLLVHKNFGRADDACFTCGFHGWKFNLDGSNKEISDEFLFRKEVIAQHVGLELVSVGVWNSLIFLNPEPHPQQTLAEALDVIPTHLAGYDFSKLRVLHDWEYCMDANWKTALEGFVEYYHANDVHSQLNPIQDTLEDQYDVYDNGVARMIIPNGLVSRRFDDRGSVSESLEELITAYGGNPEDYNHLKGYEYKKALIDTKRKWGKRHGYSHFDNLSDNQIADSWVYLAFPNMTINTLADTLILIVFKPHETDPRRSYFHTMTLSLPVTDDSPVIDPNSSRPEDFVRGWTGKERPQRTAPKEVSDLGSALSQDNYLLPHVQKGIESNGFRGALLSESEIIIRHYLAELDKRLGRA